MRLLYYVWFRDTSVPPEDQDREWVACIVIDAGTRSDAVAWGDHLAGRYSTQSGCQEVLSSGLESIESYSEIEISQLPQVEYGYEATDEEIGW